MGIAEATMGCVLGLIVLILFLYGRISALEDMLSSHHDKVTKQLTDLNASQCAWYEEIAVRQKVLCDSFNEPREYILKRKETGDDK